MPAPRAETRDAEDSWLKSSRLEAEAAWAKMFPASKPQINPRRLTGEELAMNETFGEIAQRAAGLTHIDGQKRFRADQADADLYAKGQESARKLWSGQ